MNIRRMSKKAVLWGGWRWSDVSSFTSKSEQELEELELEELDNLMEIVFYKMKLV